jgi:hypothetical protein
VNITSKLGENIKKLATDLDSQKDLYKKLQDSLKEQANQYTELVKSYK